MSPLGIGIPIAAAKSTGYQIGQSLRFNDDDSAHLTRTPASAGNRKTWTWSGWIKRGTLGTTQRFFSADDNAASATYLTLEFQSDDNLRALAGTEGSSATLVKETTMVFRDPSAWYHIVFKFDAANTSAVWYVNGEEITDLNTSTNPSNQDYQVNATSQHFLGRIGSSLASGGDHFDGYMAEVNFIDGSALGPESFGRTNVHGVWTPVGYAGSYTGNSFYLRFASGDGTDSSGLSNTWTANNFTTSGTGTDVMSDTPTTNWATLNPLIISHSGTAGSYEEGNLRRKNTANNSYAPGFSSIAVTSGKWYFECTGDTSIYVQVGFVDVTQLASVTGGGGLINPTRGWCYQSNGVVRGNNSNYYDGTPVAASTSGDIIGCAVDFDSGSAEWYVNGTQTGATLDFSSHLATGRTWYLGVTVTNEGTDVIDVNFGQRAFDISSVPSGFKALNTSNLPAPDIADGSEYFNTVLYTGNGSTQSITGVGFQPDFLWIKNRDSAVNHQLHDAVRGASVGLNSNNTNAEYTDANAVTSFDSTGWSMNNNYNSHNQSSVAYAAWNWLAANGTSSNTDGGITSTVSASPSSGFSIVSWTGSGNTTDSVGHGLGDAPKLNIIKSRDSSSLDWYIYTTVIDGSHDYLFFTAGPKNNSGIAAPTSTVINLNADIQPSGQDMIAYCFTEIEGYSKISTFEGTDADPGPFVYLGFRPALILLKNVDATQDWVIYDTKRSTYNEAYEHLHPNTSGSENTTQNDNSLDILSNGFRPMGATTSNDATNGPSQTILYIAFAENPFGGSGVSPATAR